MKENLFEKVFKTILVVILAGFFIVYYNNRDVGRYQQIGNESRIGILDTKTGKCYTPEEIRPELLLQK